MIVPGIIIPYDGQAVNIPSGFERFTDLDGRFPYGKAAGVGVQGGSDTHPHTTQTHPHLLNAHSQTVYFTGYTAVASDSVLNSPGEGSNDGIATHGHGNATGTMDGSPESSSESPTLGSASTLPPFHEVIYIKSTDYNLVPKDGIVYTQTSQTNMSLCDGSAGTPDLTDRLLRGSPTGVDAGGTGGDVQHEHDAGHGHDGASHTMSGTSGGRTGTDTRRNNQTYSTEYTSKYHTHTFTTNTAVAPIVDFEGNAGGDVTLYPPFLTLKAYKNMAIGFVPINEGAIALFTGVTLPHGWVLCDGTNGTPDLTDKFVKIHTTAGTAGGSLTHGHADLIHTHLSSPHSHEGTSGTDSTKTLAADGGSSHPRAVQGHTHALTTSSDTATYADGTMEIDDATNIPAYTEVKYIMATSSALGGGGGIVIPNFM